MRLISGPGAFRAYAQEAFSRDVRSLLRSIQVPTLVIHRRDNRYYPVALGRYLAARIEGARFVVMPGADTAPFWEDPTEWMDRSSIFYVGNVTTPTMLMTGEQDLRTPMGQTEEFYQALQYVGVPTVMVRFQGEWHGTTSKPSNFLRTQLYLRKWFAKWGTHDDRMTS